MKKKLALERTQILRLAVVALLAAGCGDDDPRGNRSVIGGNVSSASTATREVEGSSWLAWIVERVSGAVQRAYAQGDDQSLSGIEVSAESDGKTASTMTDESGRFRIDGSPTGDVTVTFRRAECEAPVEVPSVVDGSNLVLGDVSFECAVAEPATVMEEFSGIVRGTGAPIAQTIELCVETGDEHETRTVDAGEAEMRDPQGEVQSFEDLREGDRIRASGERSDPENPTLDADEIEILERNRPDPCSAPTPDETQPAGTPTATQVPETPTPGEGETPTPGEGETPTPGEGEPTATPTAGDMLGLEGLLPGGTETPTEGTPTPPAEETPPTPGEEETTPTPGEEEATPTPGEEEATPTPGEEPTAEPTGTPTA